MFSHFTTLSIKALISYEIVLLWYNLRNRELGKAKYMSERNSWNIRYKCFQFSWNATAWNWFEMTWLFSTFSTIHSNENVSLETFLGDRYTLILWTLWRRHSRKFGGYASSGSQPSVSHFLKLIPLGTNK